MKKAGRGLEELVAAIEKLLGIEGAVTTMSPGFLPDKTSGKRREHDVLLTVVNGHHTMLIAIECRDRSRPIGVPDVEGFALKCRDTRVNQGVMVSTRGYRKTALTKAKAHDIRCLNLEDSTGFNWLGMTECPQRVINVGHVHLRLNVAPGHQVPKNGTALVAADGLVVPFERVYHAVRTQAAEFIRSPREEDLDATGRILINVDCTGMHLRNEESGEQVPVANAYGLAEYSIEEYATKMHLQSYVDAMTGHLITQAAHVDLGPIGAEGRLLMLNRNAEGGVVAFVPHSPATASKLKAEGNPPKQEGGMAESRGR